MNQQGGVMKKILLAAFLTAIIIASCNKTPPSQGPAGTATVTCTHTVSPTITPTWTVSDTFTVSPTATITSTVVHPFIKEWGGYGQMDSPVCIAIDAAGDLYVTLNNSNCVRKYTSDGALLGSFGSYGAAPGQFDSPFGICIDHNGNIYVSEVNNNRVQKFDQNMVYQLSWGTQGSLQGQFSWPRGLAVDGSNNIYVADHANNRVQKFDSSGNFLMQLGQFAYPACQDGDPGFVWGVAVDDQGYVYMTDVNCNKVRKFKSDGTFVGSIGGTYGNGDNEFSSPGEMAFGLFGELFVTESNGDRVKILTKDLVYVDRWGAFGSSQGCFVSPIGIAVDSAGYIYVADTGNQKIQKFSP
jgi:sugar lactone lactonase YvrE